MPVSNLLSKETGTAGLTADRVTKKLRMQTIMNKSKIDGIRQLSWPLRSLALAPVLMLGSCVHEVTESGVYPTEPVQVQVMAEVGPGTRMEGTSFQDGDRIGVTTVYSDGTRIGTDEAMGKYQNIEYVWDAKEKKFKAGDSGGIWFMDGQISYGFWACYPFNEPEGMAGTISFNTREAQDPDTQKDKLDILWVMDPWVTNSSSPKVYFVGDSSFKRMMSRVKLILEFDSECFSGTEYGLDFDEYIEDCKVAISGLCHMGTVVPVNGASVLLMDKNMPDLIEAPWDLVEAKAQMEIDSDSRTITFPQLILAPQEASLVKFWFTDSSGNLHSSINGRRLTLERATSYEIKVKVKLQGLSVEDVVEIKDFTTGGSSSLETAQGSE